MYSRTKHQTNFCLSGATVPLCYGHFMEKQFGLHLIFIFSQAWILNSQPATDKTVSYLARFSSDASAGFSVPYPGDYFILNFPCRICFANIMVLLQKFF